MKVKTIKAHGNAYGDSWQKNANAEYDVPDKTGKNLVDAGLVRDVTEKPKAAAPAKGDG